MRNWMKRFAPLFLAGVAALGLLAVGQNPSEAQQEDGIRNCPLPGNWAVSVWRGQAGTQAEQAFATCGAAVDAAYYLDPETQSWLRYFAGRPEISSLVTLDDMQGVLALGGVGAWTPAAAVTAGQGNAVRNCPQPGKWAISVWDGRDGAGLDPALASCGPGAVGVAYYLDPYTGQWTRWFRGRPDISNLATMNNLQGIIALGSGSFTLSVDKFGDGTITSSPAGIDCGSDCTYQSASLPAGSSVVLTAAADPGSTLSHWTGCDSVADNTCTVVVDRDKTAFATFAFAEVKIPETTKVLDAATMAYLIRQEGSTYYFDPQAEAVASLEAGDVMVSDVGEGLLRKVTAVSATQQEIAVETAAASLEDAVEQGTIILRTGLASAGLQSGEAAASEGSPSERIAAAQLLEHTEEIDVELAPGVTVTGEASFSGDLDIAVSFAGWDWDCWCYPVKEVRTIATVAHNLGLEVSAGQDFEVSGEQEIGHYRFTPIWVTIGVLPVGFFPELALNVGVDGSAEAKITSEIDLANEVKVGVHYRRGSGWAPVADYQRTFEWVEPDASLGAEAKAYVAPQLSVKVYGLVGPYFDLQGYLRLSVQPLETPWWSLYGGINASAGLDMDALGLSLDDYSMSLGEKEWLLAQAAGSQDSDGDGIADVDDTCPAEAEDYDGFEDGDGCPDTDNDQDGILDSVDACPNEAENVNGLEDEDGCPDEIPTVDVSGVVNYGNGLAYDGGPGLYVSAHLCRKDPEDPAEIEDWTTGECQKTGVATARLVVGQFVLPDVSSGDYTIFITCDKCDPAEEWARQDISVKDPPEPVSVTVTLPTTSMDWPAFVGTLTQISPVAGFWLVETTSPLLGTIPVVVSLGWPSGPFWCDGTIDPDAAEGDSVEVYAILYQLGVRGWFNACRSIAHYAGSAACTTERNEWEFFLEGTGYVWGGSENPATVYCTELGYGWRIETGELGEYGVCTFPDSTECEEWAFWRGECGQDWTYCGQQGGQVITVTSTPEHPCSPGTDDTCAYCVLKC